MTTPSTYENITFTLLAQIDQEIATVEKEMQERLDRLRCQREAVKAALQVYKERMGSAEEILPTPTLIANDVHGKSQRQILELIAFKSGGVLVAKEAVRLMRDAHVFGNPDNAQSAVYSVLNRNKDRFEKVAPGVYRLVERTSKQAIPQDKRRHSTLFRAVERFRRDYPSATRTQVKDMLLERQFDFGGKDPQNAVNAAWLNIDRVRSKTRDPQLIMVS